MAMDTAMFGKRTSISVMIQCTREIEQIVPLHIVSATKEV